MVCCRRGRSQRASDTWAEAALGCIRVQFVKMRSICCRVEFRRDNDHRFFRERGTERCKFMLDDFEIVLMFVPVSGGGLGRRISDMGGEKVLDFLE